MKLNLGKQIVTVENRNLNSVISQCLEQKIKEKITEVAKREFFNVDNKTASEIYDRIKDVYTIDHIMDYYEDEILKILNKMQY